MRWKDLKASLSDFWREFRRYKIGIAGLILLLFFVSVSVLAPYIASEEGYRRWRDITFWEDLPRGVPPEWIIYFTAEKLPKHVIEDLYEAADVREIGGKVREFTYIYDYKHDYDKPPTDIIVKVKGKYYNPDRPPTIVVFLERPDDLNPKGPDLELASKKLVGVGGGANLTYIPLEARVLVTSEQSAKQKALEIARSVEPPEVIAGLTLEILDPNLVFFSKLQPGITSESRAQPLKGDYQLILKIYVFDRRDEIEFVRVILAGRVYGFMGTDSQRRDLYVGLVWGTRIALLIGLLTSTLSVWLGAMYGITSAYAGGNTELVMQRIVEIWYSIPILPILIMLAAVWKPSVWNLVLLMVVFGWTGTAIIVRSMGLQLKEQTYIEAARAVGAGGLRIITKHMLPQILPYMFASMALGVPGAILTEAGISFLGLGDVNMPTWGQILHDANANQAAINGMWWWVIPPGLAIALVGLTFVLIGNALDRVLNPRLRTR